MKKGDLGADDLAEKNSRSLAEAFGWPMWRWKPASAWIFLARSTRSQRPLDLKLAG